MSNIVEVFQEAFETDDMSNVKKEEKLKELYEISNDEQRYVIDQAFIHLCGYSFSTLKNKKLGGV